jgi:glycosyltransferase involved in cell wall biosynthesis
LKDAGHRAAIVITPSNRFGRQFSAYAANWLTDVGRTGSDERVDQVISLRFPSYAVRHPVHVSWLNHTMREYYDRWDDFSSRLSPQGRVKERARRAVIRAADTYFLKRHVTRLVAQSATIQARLDKWNGVRAEVLHPPPPPRPYRTDGYGDFVFFTSRLTPLKRADLVLRALARPEASAVRCVIGGEGEERSRLDTLARELTLGDRVSFAGRLSESDLVDHYARCRAVVFVPKDEDYGFVTVEGFASGKAVITTTDSGGPAELVRHEGNGLVTAPDDRALAAALARLTNDIGLATRLGEQAKREVGLMTWPGVVRTLVVG